MALPRTALFFRVPDTDFACEIECDRPCGYPTRGGRACTRSACKSVPFCWQHSRKAFGVKTVRRAGMGDGLVALEAFAAGELIAPYGGRVIPRRELERRYDRNSRDNRAGPYALSLQGRIYDAACRRGLGALANDPSTSTPRGRVPHPEDANADFVTYTRARGDVFTTKLNARGVPEAARARIARGQRSVWLVASKDIRAGERILVDYGDDYWEGDRVPYKVTRRRR